MDPLYFAMTLAGLMLIIGAIVIPTLIRYRADRMKQPVEGFDFIPTPEEEARLNDARQLLIQVDEFSTQAFAKLDTKLMFLNRLIEDADVRALALDTKIRTINAEVDNGAE
ncbi:MAG: hypothetical protein V3V10_02025 [Planctomycetota bacterium]